MFKVGDIVRQISSCLYFTVESVIYCGDGSYLIWSSELEKPYYYNNGTRQKNWYNASPTYMELIESPLILKQVNKHSMI